MSRHLKAYLFDDKKIVDVYAVIDIDETDHETDNVIYKLPIAEGCFVNSSCKFDECILLQSIGREDKNNEELFTDDIIMTDAITSARGTCGIYSIWIDSKCTVFIKDFMTGENFIASSVDDAVWHHEVERIGSIYELDCTELKKLAEEAMEAKK